MIGIWETIEEGCMQIQIGFDHLVLVTPDVPRTMEFYARVLDAEIRDYDGWRSGCSEYPVLHFGLWKINVHPIATDAAPRARAPFPGSADLCFVWPGSIADAASHLLDHGVQIEAGPITQEGAAGHGQSVYFRDPDGNLLEFISYEVL